MSEKKVDKQNCPVCFTDKKSNSFEKLPCSHLLWYTFMLSLFKFSKKCLKKWKGEGKNTCPFCRALIDPNEQPSIIDDFLFSIPRLFMTDMLDDYFRFITLPELHPTPLISSVSLFSHRISHRRIRHSSAFTPIIRRRTHFFMERSTNTEEVIDLTGDDDEEDELEELFVRQEEEEEEEEHQEHQQRDEQQQTDEENNSQTDNNIQSRKRRRTIDSGKNNRKVKRSRR